MIHEGPGNIIQFEEIKKRLREHPPKAETPEAQQRLDATTACANEIGDVLKKYNMDMIALPKLEIIAPGVFRLLGDLVIKPRN